MPGKRKLRQGDLGRMRLLGAPHRPMMTEALGQPSLPYALACLFLAEELESFQEQTSELRRELVNLKSGAGPAAAPVTLSVKSKGGFSKEGPEDTRASQSQAASSQALEDARVGGGLPRMCPVCTPFCACFKGLQIMLLKMLHPFNCSAAPG